MRTQLAAFAAGDSERDTRSSSVMDGCFKSMAVEIENQQRKRQGVQGPRQRQASSPVELVLERFEVARVLLDAFLLHFVLELLYGIDVCLALQ